MHTLVGSTAGGVSQSACLPATACRFVGRIYDVAESYDLRHVNEMIHGYGSYLGRYVSIRYLVNRMRCRLVGRYLAALISAHDLDEQEQDDTGLYSYP